MLRVRMFLIIILALASLTTVEGVSVHRVAATPSPPYVRGWGGIFADSSSLTANLDIIKARGYNGFRCMIYNSDLGRRPSIASIVNAVNTAKSYGLWIILDHHAYTDSFDADPEWDQVVAAVQNLYDKIIYEPQNEPAYSLSTLTSMYQNWINKVRATGDTHWIIVSIDYQGFGSPGDSTFLSLFPQVTDPLDRIFYNFHDYYFYSYHPGWSVSDAQSYADNVPAAVASLEQAYGRPVLTTETGADASGGGSWPPDSLPVSGNPGSAGYSPESLAYVIEEVKGLTRQGTGYMIWTADDWSGTPGAGATGALNIWGQYLPYPSQSGPPPVTGDFNIQPSSPQLNTPVSFAASASNGTAPYTFSWSFGDGVTGTGQQVTHTFSAPQTYSVTLNISDSAGGQFTATHTITVANTSCTLCGGTLNLNLLIAFALGSTALFLVLVLRRRQSHSERIES